MNSQIIFHNHSQIVPYLDQAEYIKQKMIKRSLLLQKKEASSLKSVSLRALFSSGTYPRPIYEKAQVSVLSATREDTLNLVSKTIHDTMDRMDYNGVQPFVKLIEHVKQGKPISELELDAQGEFPSTTCVGMTQAIIEALKNNHGIEASVVAQRKKGTQGFGHACALIYCQDGFILIDPTNDPKKRLFSLPYKSKELIDGKQFITRSSQDVVPIREISSQGSFDYCSHISNAADLILKHYMAEEPFLSNVNPAFPISAYNQDGSASKCIWISIINETLTLKNLTYAISDMRRTNEIDIEDVEDHELVMELKKFYETGSPTFKISFQELCHKLMRFVDNIELVKEVFASVHI